MGIGGKKSVRDMSALFNTSRSTTVTMKQEGPEKPIRCQPPKSAAECHISIQQEIRESIVELIAEDKSHSLRTILISNELKKRGKSAHTLHLHILYDIQSIRSRQLRTLKTNETFTKLYFHISLCCMLLRYPNPICISISHGLY